MGSNKLQFKTNKSDHFSGPFTQKLGCWSRWSPTHQQRILTRNGRYEPITAHLKAKLPITAKQLSYLTI
jgi:hypothetical protein